MAEDLFFNQTETKAETYQQAYQSIKALIAGENDLIANLSNTAAVLKQAFNFYWVGFYLLKDGELVLGPFQGTVACTRIAIGKGVCGTSALKKETILVPNVDEFPGHIACSAFSKSEIVVPIIVDGKLIGVLDVDSDKLDDFDEMDKEWLEEIVGVLSNLTKQDH